MNYYFTGVLVIAFIMLTVIVAPIWSIDLYINVAMF